MSDARVRRQETKFSDVTAIGQPPEGVVAARGDEDDLHGAIRRYDFEFRLTKMLGHGKTPLQCSPIRPAFQPRRLFLPNHPGSPAPSDSSAYCVADQQPGACASG